MENILNFIGNEFVAPKQGEYLAKLDPSTGEAYLNVADSNEVDVVKAISAAHKAQEAWAKFKTSERSEFLQKIASGIEARLEEFAEAESRDTGKPLHLARTLDIPRAIWNFRFFASRILHVDNQSTDMDGEAINYTLRQPLGVVGLISPWNLPLYLLSWKIAPAIAVGNAVVCKPSELTPATANLLAEVCVQVGLPAGVVNIVHGRGDRAGQTMVTHPGVAAISFTGGTVTGEKIQMAAAHTLKRTSLELGGKNATLIFDDVNLDKIVPEIVRASFLNQGEICLCGETILVQEKLYQPFLEKFVAATKALKVGDRKLSDTYMGPLISRAHLEKVQKCVKQATQESGKILTGHELLELSEDLKKGYFIRPTVIADLSNCSDLHQTEIFGPVVTVTSFKYLHDAVRLANNTPYGLSASVWTTNLTRAHKAAQGLDVGTVWINTWLKRDLRVPFGGAKSSGLGREGGDHSLDFFTETKNVCVQL